MSHPFSELAELLQTRENPIGEGCRSG